MSNVKTLLVDSMNMMYRSYYAMPSLKNRDGQCIGAVLGFLNSLNRFANDFENVIVVWDPPISKTRRHELYPQYKMNRPPMDLDMKSQLPVMKEALDAFGYCQVVSSEDHEADDVIATLSRKVFSECNVCVLSRDKDLAQLIDREKRISLLDPVSGDILAYDDVETKFGVGPESLRDALALAGDSSDNIPGVPGIGMKTAAMLLTRFGGCVENIYSNIEDVPGKKRKENLRNHRDNVEIAYELVRLEDNIPLNCISILHHDDGEDSKDIADLEMIHRVSKIPSLSCVSTRQAIEEFCDHYYLNDLRRRMLTQWKEYDDTYSSSFQ